MFIQKSIYSGAILEIEQMECNDRGKVICRNANIADTTDKQKKINKKLQMQKLMRTMCCNFCKGDLLITLTYADIQPDDKTALLNLRKFLRKLRLYCKKNTKKELKYVAVTERGDKNGRLHHHIVIKQIDLLPRVLLDMWGNGRVDMESLDGDPYYRWLMIYLDKAQRTIKGQKAWSCSRNLNKPIQAPNKIIKRKVLSREPKVPKDYYILDWVLKEDKRGQSRYIIAIRHDRLAEIPPQVLVEIEKAKENEMFWRT